MISLWLDCHTQEEIAENIGISRDNYNKTFLGGFPELEKLTKNLIESGIPHLDVNEVVQDSFK